MPDQITQARDHANSFFRCGIDAVDPAQAVLAALSVSSENRLLIKRGSTTKQEHNRSADWSKIHILAFGKAAIAMASAAHAVIPATLTQQTGIVITNIENKQQLEGFDVMVAGHPVPDEAGAYAAQLLAQRAKDAGPNELLLVLISGGGSALLPYPAHGISLQEKIDTTKLLLSSGATINEMNCVRKHLSQIKGGQLARMAYPADLHGLILSDVIGDDLSAIASGPTVPDPTTFQQAIDTLQDHQVWNQTPIPVQKHLLAGSRHQTPETPKPSDPVFARCEQTLIGSNALSLRAVEMAASKQGYQTIIYQTQLCGEASEEADKLCQFALQQYPSLTQPSAIIAGGETTVTLQGSGLGGRNQEFALAFALAAKQHQLPGLWVFLSGGTDGRDGPTNAAGGLVDSTSLARLQNKGHNAAAFLADNDSYHALQYTNDLLLCGATGTNVADLQILLLIPTAE